MTGNFIGDSVTSAMQSGLPPGIRKGVLLHQQIDTFTDSHPVVRLSKERLRPRYRKYAGVITDIFYDHFLAANWNEYAKNSLRDYADEVYAFLETQRPLFPPRSLQFYEYMRRADALFIYAEVNGIRKVMQGMSRRSVFESGMETSTEELLEHYDVFGEEFRTFFPELIRMADAFRTSC